MAHIFSKNPEVMRTKKNHHFLLFEFVITVSCLNPQYLMIFSKYMRLLNTYQDEQELKNLNKSINFHKKNSVILEKMFFSVNEKERELCF